jgi:hypothetical protein
MLTLNTRKITREKTSLFQCPPVDASHSNTNEKNEKKNISGGEAEGVGNKSGVGRGQGWGGGGGVPLGRGRVRGMSLDTLPKSLAG